MNVGMGHVQCVLVKGHMLSSQLRPKLSVIVTVFLFITKTFLLRPGRPHDCQGPRGEADGQAGQGAEEDVQEAEDPHPHPGERDQPSDQDGEGGQVELLLI